MSSHLAHNHTGDDHNDIHKQESISNKDGFWENSLSFLKNVWRTKSQKTDQVNYTSTNNDHEERSVSEGSPPQIKAKSSSVIREIENLSLNEERYSNERINPSRNFNQNLASNDLSHLAQVDSVRRRTDRLNSHPNSDPNRGVYQNDTDESVHECESIYDDNTSNYESLDEDDFDDHHDEDDETYNHYMRQNFDQILISERRGRRQDCILRAQFDREKKEEEFLRWKKRKESRFENHRLNRYMHPSNSNTQFIFEGEFERPVYARSERSTHNSQHKTNPNRKSVRRNANFDSINLSGKEDYFVELESRFENKMMEALKKQKNELMFEKQKEEILLEKQKAELQFEKDKAELMLEKQKIELMLEQQKSQTMFKDENYHINSNVPNWQKNIQYRNNNEAIYESRSQDVDQSHNSRNEQYINKPSNKPTINFSGNKGGEFQILLLGGTGTGKSTLINTMANYFLGGKLPYPKVVIPTKYFRTTEKNFRSAHSEASLDDVTKSKTTKCCTYSFTHPQNSGLKFVFIDSPGLSDTNGTKQDDENIQEIINMAISAGSLSALVVIANGTEARVTPSIKNTLVLLANNLPDVLVDSNLLLVLTKCSKNSACFSEETFSNEITEPKAIFYMDNQAFCSDPRTWRDDEDAYEELQLKFEQSNRTFDKLLQQITGMSNTSTEAFKTMKDLRDKLKSQIATISLDIANIQKVQDSLEAAQKALKLTGDQKNSFKNFKKSETITLKKIVPASYHSTVCTKHFLQDIICHEHCGLEFMNKAGNSGFSSCACMGSSSECTKCGCGPEAHYHAKVQLETKTETFDKVLQDIKAKYDMADQDFNKFSSDANSFQSTLKNLQAAADQKYKQIHQLCYDLSKICSRFNFVDELHANIENMKQDARQIKNSNLRKTAEDGIANLKKLADDLTSGQTRSASIKTNNPPKKNIPLEFD